MLDDLRKQADEETYEDYVEGLVLEDSTNPSENRFLGMTPPQRFAIALMLLFITCLVGSLWLLVSEKVVPPFLY